MENQDKTTALQENIKRLESFINGMERDCEKMSTDILNKLCKRAIKGMNTLEAKLAGSTDDYPSDFRFFDILCVELETRTYDEINPYLQESVEGILMAEYDKLSSMEKFILDHSECWALMDGENDKIKKKILDVFADARFRHLEVKKIANYLSRI